MNPGEVVGRNATGRLTLAGFVLDLNESELLTPENQPAALRRQALDVLLVLGRHVGRVVPKDTLMREVWPGVVVGDDSLVQAIAEIRRVLGDADHQLVRTVARRGYMRVAPPGIGAGAQSLEVSLHSGKFRPVPARSFVLGLVAAGVLAVFSAWLLQDRPDERDAARSSDAAERAPRAAAPSVAALGTSLIVLPLESAAGDPGWFADSVTTDLTTSLAQIGDLLVIGRGTARSLSGLMG